MSFKLPRSKRPPRFSIGGIEVVPGDGLEVAFDPSPEVFCKPEPESEKTWRPRRLRINWRKKVCGISVLWMVIGLTTFVVGIVMGAIIVSQYAFTAKIQGTLSSVASAAASSTSGPTMTQLLITTTPGSSTTQPPSSFTTATGTFLNAAQTSSGVSSDVNYQTFTGALGGIAADPVTSTNDSSRPFEVAGDVFPDLSEADTRSCDNQHNACAQFVNNNVDTGSVTVGDCDTQLDACLAAGASASATQTAASATVT